MILFSVHIIKERMKCHTKERIQEGLQCIVCVSKVLHEYFVKSVHHKGKERQ